MDDKQLMAQIAAGDQAALQTLLRRHGPLLQYILKPILTDPREREECLADISLRLWQRAGDYAPWDMESTLDSLAQGWLLARAAHRPVIRMGLAPEASLAGAILAGPAHPALGARVMGRALLTAVRSLAAREAGGRLAERLEAPRACQGYFWGHAKELRPAWAELGLGPGNVRYAEDDALRLWLRP